MSTIAPTLHSRPLCHLFAQRSYLVCLFLPDKGLWEEYEKTDLKVRGAGGGGAVL